jgi:hypothetical protein
VTNDQHNLDLEIFETELITACALRFDGYAYADEVGFDYTGNTNDSEQQVAHVVKSFVANPDWDRPRNDLHMILFMLQRGLIKEGWLKWNSQEAKVIRLLFLELCHDDIPPQFRLEEWYQRWHERYKPVLDQCIAFILDRHNTTNYPDSKC